MELVNAATDPRTAELRERAREWLLRMARYGAKERVYGKRVKRLEVGWVVNGNICPNVDAAVHELLRPDC